MKTDAFWISNAVGWLFMTGSWALPLLTKNQKLKNLYGLSLSAIALGVFISTGIYLFVK